MQLRIECVGRFTTPGFKNGPPWSNPGVAQALAMARGSETTTLATVIVLVKRGTARLHCPTGNLFDLHGLVRKCRGEVYSPPLWWQEFGTDAIAALAKFQASLAHGSKSSGFDPTR